MLDTNDFQFSYQYKDDGKIMEIHHLWFDEEQRGEGHANFVIETLFRIAYKNECKVVEVSIGGGERAEGFLKKNGFHVYNRRPYSDKTIELSEVDWEYGVDAVRSI